MDVGNLHYIDTVLSLGGAALVPVAIIKITISYCGSPETIYKILNRKTTAMADPLIAHRIKTLLFRVVDIHNNIFTTAIRSKQKYQREHFIPEVWCRTVKFRRDFTTGNNSDK